MIVKSQRNYICTEVSINLPKEWEASDLDGSTHRATRITFQQDQLKVFLQKDGDVEELDMTQIGKAHVVGTKQTVSYTVSCKGLVAKAREEEMTSSSIEVQMHECLPSESRVKAAIQRSRIAG